MDKLDHHYKRREWDELYRELRKQNLFKQKSSMLIVQGDCDVYFVDCTGFDVDRIMDLIPTDHAVLGRAASTRVDHISLLEFLHVIGEIWPGAMDKWSWLGLSFMEGAIPYANDALSSADDIIWWEITDKVTNEAEKTDYHAVVTEFCKFFGVDHIGPHHPGERPRYEAAVDTDEEEEDE